MDFGFVAGDTDKTIYVRLRDSSTGLAKTGLAYNSSGVVFSYTLPLAARAAITPATQTVTGAHSDGGFVEIDATNAKGLYRLDLPDAAIASGAFTVISVQFTGVISESVLIPLHTRRVNATQIGSQNVGLSSDNRLRVDVAEWNDIPLATTNPLPNAAADAAGGLPISTAGGLDLDAKLANTNEVTVARMGALTDWIDGGRLDLLLDAIKVITDALGATAAARLALSGGQIIPGTVDTVTNTHTPTTTEFQADDITEATADHFNGRIVIFTSGNLEGQATDITSYEAVGGIGQFTVTAMTEAPANNDTFIIV